MNSVNIPTLVVSVLLAAAFAAGVTFALVTVMEPGANQPVRPSMQRTSDNGAEATANDEWQGEFEALDAQLRQMRNEIPAGVDSAAIDRRLAELTARLQRLEQMVSAGRLPSGDNVPESTEGGAEVAPRVVPPAGELAMAIEAVIAQREEEQRLKAEAERNAQIEEGLQRQRDWMGQIYTIAVDKMSTELGLNGAQVDSLRGLLDWRMEQLMVSRDQRVPRDERPDWQTVNDEYARRMTSLLSPQQMQIYEEKKLGDFGVYQRDLQRQQNNDNGGGGSSRGR